MITSTVIPVYAHLLLERTRKASEQAVAANLEKSRFLAQASHDLRQPIHSIGLFTACLREARLGDQEQRLVDSIDRSLLNVSQLFRSILDLYTLDNGRVLPNYQVLHLGDFLADLVLQNTEAARWAGVELRLRPCAQWVRVDPVLLATMVQNVLSNCFKYGAQRPVLIGVRQCGDGLAIEVHDQGRGIDKEHLLKVFEEFYRVRHQRDKDVEGVGLGLSIVKRLGLLMELNVTIRSRLGHGTSVRLYRVARALPPNNPTFQDDAHQTGMLTGLKVCLIEDDQNVLLATQALLERWGCKVQAQLSGLNLTSDCDVIIADYDLGSSATGIECIEQLRQQRGWTIPALILSGHDAQRIHAQLKERQIALLSKPVRPAELRATLRALSQP